MRQGTKSSTIAADLDKVPIRVEEIDRLDGPAGTALYHGPLHYLDTLVRKLGPHLIQRPAGNEAEIGVVAQIDAA